jgi:hypothetical protein
MNVPLFALPPDAITILIRSLAIVILSVTAVPPARREMRRPRLNASPAAALALRSH